MLQHRHVAYGRVQTSIKEEGSLEDELSAWPIIAIALVISLLAASSAAVIISSNGWTPDDLHFSAGNNDTTYEMIKSVSCPSLSVNDSWCGYGAAPSEEVWESIVDGGAYDEAIICHANEGDMRDIRL